MAVVVLAADKQGWFSITPPGSNETREICRNAPLQLASLPLLHFLSDRSSASASPSSLPFSLVGAATNLGKQEFLREIGAVTPSVPQSSSQSAGHLVDRAAQGGVARRLCPSAFCSVPTRTDQVANFTFLPSFLPLPHIRANRFRDISAQLRRSNCWIGVLPLHMRRAGMFKASAFWLRDHRQSFHVQW